MSSNPNHPGTAPPPHPWKKGQQGGYSSLILEVAVCRDEFGRVFSAHQLQDELDRQTVMTWPGGGQEAVAFALLLEAARREAILGIILKMSKDPDYLASATASDEARREAIEELAKIVRVQVNRTLRDVAASVVEEAFVLAQSNR